MIIRILETRNFQFVAAGRTAPSAERALLDGIRKHCDQYGIPLEGFLEDYPIFEGSMFYVEGGECYRDGTLLRDARDNG